MWHWVHMRLWLLQVKLRVKLEQRIALILSIYFWRPLKSLVYSIQNKTKWAVNAWKEWSKERLADETEQSQSCFYWHLWHEQEYWISSFVVEARLKESDIHYPTTPYIVSCCGLQWHLRTNKPEINFFYRFYIFRVSASIRFTNEASKFEKKSGWCHCRVDEK